MKFSNPNILYALFLLVIPFIIHLFNFRRYKKVYFTNVKFIKTIQRDSNKQRNTKHLLILISRILMFSALVIAFAQPYIPVNKKIVDKKKNSVSIYIDNSFTMEAVARNGNLFSIAKEKAKEIINSYNLSDNYNILTNDNEGKYQRFLSKEEAKDLLTELKISPSQSMLSEILKKQNNILQNTQNTNKVNFIISDFNKNTYDFDKFKIDKNITTILIPLTSQNISNIYIDSCWFDKPLVQINQNVTINFRIKNNSDKEKTAVPLKLFLNDKSKNITSFNINANSEKIVKLSYLSSEKGIQNGYAEIIDYPIVYDDKFFFSYNVTDKIKVGVIDGEDTENTYINSVFKNDSLINLINFSEKNINFSIIRSCNLLIINNIKKISTGLKSEVKNFIEKGGSILVSPNIDADIENYKDFLLSFGKVYYTSIDTVKQKIKVINYQHSIYKDVFEKVTENTEIPIIKKHFKINSNSNVVYDKLLTLENGDAILTETTINKGKLYLFNSSFDESSGSLVNNYIFPLTIYKIALSSIYNQKLYYTIGVNENISLLGNSNNDKNIYKIKTEKEEIIPEMKSIGSETLIYLNNSIKQAGNYNIERNNKIVNNISINFSRIKSGLNTYSIDELKKNILGKNLYNFKVIDSTNKPLNKIIDEMNNGKKYWKVFIILCLVFITIEILLIRYFNVKQKHKTF